MSNSYKKFPVLKPWYKQKFIQKRQASKAVRRVVDIPNGGKYKYIYERYNINDFTYYQPKYKENGVIIDKWYFKTIRK